MRKTDREGLSACGAAARAGGVRTAKVQCTRRLGDVSGSGYANTPETRWYYVLYVLKFILYNTAMYYLSVQ